MNKEQLKKLENDLRVAAEKLRASSDLKASIGADAQLSRSTDAAMSQEKGRGHKRQRG